MRALATGVAVVFCLVGVIFIGQGLGYIRGSFMTGQLMWSAVGAVLLGLAALLSWSAWRPR